MAASTNNWVTLNVGGKKFQTTKTTLSKHANSFFWRLVNSEESHLESLKDQSGAYLIDRDPFYFGPILNYLRHGKLILDSNVSAHGVLEEAEFYNIEQLIQLINNQLKEQKDLNENRRVYRVLQCNLMEITNILSTITTHHGWKFEQLVKYDENSQNSGFLCIVSKVFPPSSIIPNTFD